MLYHIMNIGIKRYYLRFNLNEINLLVKRYPFTTAIGIGGANAVTCDYIIQTYVNGKNWESIDYKRLQFYCIWGLLYNGVFTYRLHSKMYPYLYGSMNFQKRTLASWVTDMTFKPVLFTLPVFYSSRDIICNNGVSVEQIKGSLMTYYNNLKMDITNSWMIWGPAHIFTFTIVPIHLKVPWICFVNFIWGLLISHTRG